MAESPRTGALHHLTLTVTDVERSITFYKDHLGFEIVVKFEPGRALLSNGSVLLALGPAYFAQEAISGDHFSEFRVGLDHLSFSVESLKVLEEAAAYFDEQGIDRGEIKDLGEGFGIFVMAFRDPDNIQLELTAPYAA
jgi:catechol 2,3-dioxygenase-like lactoylglutathione lyase family enzyme